MSNWKERFYDLLKDYLNEEYDWKIKEIIAAKDYTYIDSYCDTCYYEYTRLKVTFIDELGERVTKDHLDSFSNLMESLT